MQMTTVRTRDPEYLKKLGDSGIKIYYVVTSTRWNQPGGKNQFWGGEGEAPDGISEAVSYMDALLAAVPDAYVFLRLNVSPPTEWVNAHPEEQVTYNDGSHEPVICTSVSGEVLGGMHSLCSQRWREDADKALAEYFDELERTPHFDRIIGFFLCAGGTSEWYYPNSLVLGADSSNGVPGATPEPGAKKPRYGDFSEPFRKEYEKYLRDKYQDVETLRRVWSRPDATFENPAIPTIEERQFIYKADEKIQQALRDWELEGRAIGMKLDMNAQQPANVGVFLNGNGYQHVADFYSAWHRGTANTIVHFANTLKGRYPNLLVGAFYGSYGCTSFFDGSTASGTLAILDSGVVDFLAAPGVYNNREPGGVVAQREMQDSFRLRNEIYICEDDSRTHRCKPWMQRDAMALYSIEDSINTLKRDFARDICEEINGWWFDMGGDWYDDPDILALFKRQQETARFAYSLDRTKKNEIALIYDAESAHVVSQQTCSLVLDFWRTSDLHRIGAPVDYYFHNDLTRPDMTDYKLYIMVNQYCLTDAEREAVFAKVRRSNATVLWLYAPGFFNSDAATVMAPENIGKATGLKLGMYGRTIFPHFRADITHPAMRLASATQRYGYIDRDVHSNIWISPTVLPPAYVNPAFFVDDPEAEVLGRYCADGKPAMALSYKNGFPSIYCATQVLRSDAIASIAAWSGCHLYTNAEDVLYANENFVAVHAKDDGKRTVRFKKPCSPYEVYERKTYGNNIDHIETHMKLGETKMWSLAGAF
jgi:hypothetical protein